MKAFVNGEVITLSDEELAVQNEAASSMMLVGTAQVDKERDRRIDAGFLFGGVLYQSDKEARENIAGASTAAVGVMLAGAQAGDFRWHGGDTDFAWIAADNSTHVMDAQTMFAFGQAALEHKRAHIFAARALKEQEPIPTNYEDDAYWPATLVE